MIAGPDGQGSLRGVAHHPEVLRVVAKVRGTGLSSGLNAINVEALWSPAKGGYSS